MIWVSFLIFLAFLGGTGYYTFKQIQKYSPNSNDISVKDNIEKAQDFLPFVDIKDSVIDLGGTYRAIIEVSSLNFFLKTKIEQDNIEIAFNGLLNSLNYPIVLYTQTRALSFEKMLKSLDKDIQKTLTVFPQLENYARVYVSGVANINEFVGGGLNKRNFVIVPYDEAVTMPNLSKEEKYEYALKEIYNRAESVCEGLRNCGLQAVRLNTEELLRLVVTTYHRSDDSSLGTILGQDFRRLIINDKPIIYPTTARQKLHQIIFEFENRLKMEVATPEIALNLEDDYQKFMLSLANFAKVTKLKDTNEINMYNPFYDIKEKKNKDFDIEEDEIYEQEFIEDDLM